jgi:hypothetical protein
LLNALEVPKVVQNVFSLKFEETIPRKEVIIIDCVTLISMGGQQIRRIRETVRKCSTMQVASIVEGYNSL